jgi:hypothetical protein
MTSLAAAPLLFALNAYALPTCVHDPLDRCNLEYDRHILGKGYLYPGKTSEERKAHYDLEQAKERLKVFQENLRILQAKGKQGYIEEQTALEYMGEFGTTYTIKGKIAGTYECLRELKTSCLPENSALAKARHRAVDRGIYWDFAVWDAEDGLRRTTEQIEGYTEVIRGFDENASGAASSQPQKQRKIKAEKEVIPPSSSAETKSVLHIKTEYDKDNIHYKNIFALTPAQMEKVHAYRQAGKIGNAAELADWLFNHDVPLDDLDGESAHVEMWPNRTVRTRSYHMGEQQGDEKVTTDLAGMPGVTVIPQPQ